MATQFITNDKGKKTGVIVPITEYEDMLHQHHLTLELTEGYKKMIDSMIEQENNGEAKYVPFDQIKNRFLRK